MRRKYIHRSLQNLEEEIEKLNNETESHKEQKELYQGQILELSNQWMIIS